MLNKENELKYELEGKYEIKRLYIDKIKQDLDDLKDLRMFGASLDLCGFGLKVCNFEFKNACAFEYHLRMLNKTRNNNWTQARLLKELNMQAIDEGITLNQLIRLYKNIKSDFMLLIINTTRPYQITNIITSQPEIMLLYFT